MKIVMKIGYFHELLHSLLTNNEDAKLNLEIEVRLAVYRYAVRKGVPLAGGLYENPLLPGI